MKKAILIASLILLFNVQAFIASPGESQKRTEVHALWAHPTDVEKSAESVRQFVARCKKAHIDVIVMDIKDSIGGLYWKSKKFPQAIAPGYENFDLLENLVREAHAVGIKVDAWLVDNMEGVNGAAYREHPEWAQLNPDGETTLSEKLGKIRQYPYVWMCPARRPGYVDQWLIPLFEEIAANYKVDSVHHDYVRYPGDVAPDSYCFCDYCLEHVPRYAMLSYETRPNERYRVAHNQPVIQANWWTDPTMLPSDWKSMDRREKADFLLNGRTIPGGPPDMRYFFYDYRAHQIETLVRETAEGIHRVNPNVEMSAAVFKNPITSGRFIGQRWNQWSQWINVFMPMTYRSHFAGSFDSYLDHLTESTARQMEWIGGKRPVYAGIASTYLFKEEYQPLDAMRDSLADLQTLPQTDVKGRSEKVRVVQESYQTVRQTLQRVAPALEKKFTPMVSALRANSNNSGVADLAQQLAAMRADMPAGYLPPEKLRLSIIAARKAKPDGIAIFAGSSLTREKLWGVLEEEFK